jgi:hypothetical protein
MVQTGGTTASDYIGSELDFTETAADLSIDFDVWIDTAAEFGLRIYQYDPTFGQYFDEVQISYDDTTGLRGVDWLIPDYVNCGTITSQTWATISVVIDHDGGAFDVKINARLRLHRHGHALGRRQPIGSIAIIDCR